MTEISNAKTYSRLRARLIIDKASLDEELVDMPSLLHDALECAANAIAVRDDAKRDLDYVTADASMELRNREKKPAEMAIPGMVQLTQPVQDALSKYDSANNDLAFWNAIVQGMDAKQTSLKALVQLSAQGYFTVNSAVENRREEVHVQRKRLRGDT
jgi:hypothetical protein